MIHTGFRTNYFAKCWDVTPGPGNFTKVRLSISRKNRDGTGYEQEFSGFCTFIGEAHTKAATLKAGDRIKLGDVDVTTTYDKAKNKEYVNYKVFSYELANFDDPAPVEVDSNPVEGEASGDGLPF